MNEMNHSLLHALASRKATALLMGAFTMAILARVGLGLRHEPLLVAPLALLFLQLVVCLALHHRAFFRRPGLFLFHAGLLLLLLGALWGRLTSLHGYFEVTEWGQCPQRAFQVQQGPLYPDRLRDFAFLQDAVRVVRGREGAIEDVVSQVALLQGGREVLRTDFSYHRPLTYRGHRFYYAGERGLSLVFSYHEEGKGGKEVWAVNLPVHTQRLSPKADFRLPGGWISVQAHLHLEARREGEEEGWDFSVPKDSRVELTFNDGLTQEKATFRVGGQVRLRWGVLALEDVRLYNGYIVRYDPSLSFLLGASLLSAAGLILAFVEPALGYKEQARLRALPQRDSRPVSVVRGEGRLEL